MPPSIGSSAAEHSDAFREHRHVCLKTIESRVDTKIRGQLTLDPYEIDGMRASLLQKLYGRITEFVRIGRDVSTANALGAEGAVYSMDEEEEPLAYSKRGQS